LQPEFADALDLATRSNVGMVLANRHNQTLFANPATIELLERPLEEILAPRRLEDWLPGSCVPKVQAQLAARIRGVCSPYGTRIRRQSGRPIDVFIWPTPLFSRGGDFLGSLALVTHAGDRSLLHASEILRQRYELMFGAAQRGAREPRPARVPRSQAGWPELSRREREVAGLFVQGRRPAEIAAQLGLSVHTVRSHLRFMYRKLGVTSQIEFAARLLEHPACPE
jgi:DNA-binding CsgD family transcriptional regulator